MARRTSPASTRSSSKPPGSKPGDGKVAPEPGLTALAAYAAAAARGEGPICVIFHSNIYTDYASSKECAEAVQKLCTLPLLAGSNISADFVKATVGACIDIVVHCEMEPDGKRKVREIAAVSFDNAKQTVAVDVIEMGSRA